MPQTLLFPVECLRCGRPCRTGTPDLACNWNDPWPAGHAPKGGWL